MRPGEWLFILVALLLVGGAGRLAYIEYSQGATLRAEAERQQTATLTIPAQRGDILDARSRVLAGSMRRPSVFVDPSGLEDPKFAAHSVAPLFGLDGDELHDRIMARRDRGFMWVKRNVAEEELAAFEQVRRERRLGAFVVRQEPRRMYPLGRTAAHIIGFVGMDDEGQPDQLGLAGIEQSFDEALRGVPGQRTATVDVRRRRLRERTQEYVPPRDGASVVLTIDAYIQKLAEDHIQQAVEERKAAWGTAVVIDPQSGEVLAMAVAPDFDPAAPLPAGAAPGSPEHHAAEEALRNRAIADSYEPGSIFKPFVASAALDEQLVRLDESFAINGPARQFGRRTIHDTHPYGTLTVQQIISKSSNIGMGLIGARAGNARLNRYVRSFGFGDLTGIELPGEHTGLVQDFPRWTDYSTQSVPIGQEIAVTPIQIVTAFSVFANGGVLYRPRIVRGVLSGDGQVLADYSEPVPLRRVLDPATADQFRRQALVEVVTEGTGRRAQIPDYQVFGKTGTAQIARPDGRGYEPGAYMGSFVCGAPANQPRVVVLVSVCRPSAGFYYGGQVAAPVAAEIVADTLAYMHVPPELPPEPPRGRR